MNNPADLQVKDDRITVFGKTVDTERSLHIPPSTMEEILHGPDEEWVSDILPQIEGVILDDTAQGKADKIAFVRLSPCALAYLWAEQPEFRSLIAAGQVNPEGTEILVLGLTFLGKEYNVLVPKVQPADRYPIATIDKNGDVV